MSSPPLFKVVTLLFIVFGMAGSSGAARPDPVSLNGNWELSVDQGKTWRAATVPATFEQQIDRKFDGVAWLRRTLPKVEVPAGHQVILQFDGVATQAEALVNGTSVGQHLGGWTPWRCDITSWMKSPADQCELLVKVDEKVGHNTQGFLPIIAPHFGGIWQNVSLITLPTRRFDDLRCLAWGDAIRSELQLDVHLHLADAAELPARTQLSVAVRGLHDAEWSLDHTIPVTLRDGRMQANIAWRDFQAAPAKKDTAAAGPPRGSGAALAPELWSPDNPTRYRVRLRLRRGPTVDDELLTTAAFRTVKTQGRQLLLNGRPLQVRGILNWGYQQHGNAPTLDPNIMRSEIRFAQERGFNLMKFCLWVPPKRYLELADELGMLVWLEYPAWHPQFTPQFLEPLRKEYDAFFHYDRRHPSIILRSLTCETGHGADIQVVRALYEQCRATVPNAIVEDDSSWIEWNRVHDFYDDHPYGNNHTWPATLKRLNQFIDERKAKPLLLGEAIAADTWYGPTSADPLWRDAPSPPISAEGNRQWLEQISSRLAPGSLNTLSDDSRRYAHLMRKYQIETYRRDVPAGGYVVSVLRDFSLAGMGLIDFFDQPKTTPTDWAWHGDVALLLRTEQDVRCFSSRSNIRGEVLLSWYAPTAPNGFSSPLKLRLRDANGRLLQEQEVSLEKVEPGQVTRVTEFKWEPIATNVPVGVVMEVELVDRGQRWTNEWPLWTVPDPPESRDHVTAHSSWKFNGKSIDEKGGAVSDFAEWRPADGSNQTVLARRFDRALLEFLERGGRVLLVPDDGPGSTPLRQHWFLRGGPVVNRALATKTFSRDLLVELQHFDLAGPVIPELTDWERFEPLVLLWDNHDIAQVKTHGLALELNVGKGKLLVSALRHDGKNNAAGAWLLNQWIERLTGFQPTESPRGADNAEWLRGELTRRELPLTSAPWRFQIDADHKGPEKKWQTADFDDSQWPKIGIDRHWEGQGYPTLDGWAWYRTTVTVPDDWPAAGYLHFTGVDDYYRVYVDGQLIGSGGDIEKKLTAFEERKSHKLPQPLKPGQKLSIAIEVYDWYGAGGIFRPISLTTSPQNGMPPWWKPMGKE